MSKHIFLSYAREDADAVRRIRSRLQKVGLRTWLDEHDLLPGQDWESAIRGAIRESGAFVAFLSTSAVDKTGFVQKEIREALDLAERMPDGKTFIIPARLDECVVPERLKRWQRIDLFKRGGYSRLQSVLLVQPGVTHRAGPREAPKALFDTSADHVLYELLTRSGHVVYARLSEHRYAVGQGHFYVIRPEIPEPIMQLQSRVADFRRIAANSVTGLLKRNAPWRRPLNLVVRTAGAPGGATLVAQSATATMGVDPQYWALAMLLTRSPDVYIGDDANNLFYIEENKRVVMIIAPRRLTDEERAILRRA